MQSCTNSQPSLILLLSTSCRHFRPFFVLIELNENRCLGLLHFLANEDSAPQRSSRWQLNMCVWQYKQRWIDAFPRGGDKERLRGRQRVRESERERWRWQRDTGSVTVSCRLVSLFLSSALGRSLAHNMESINPHRIPLSPPDTCPVCLPASLSVFPSLRARCS